MRIGVDFDNTLIDYDHVFADLAVRRGLLPQGVARSKSAVRAVLRRAPEGELEWRKLQGAVYGPGIGAARLHDGARIFLEACHRRGLPVFVVSHKTEFSEYDPTGTNLREAALQWMGAQGLFAVIPEQNVFFNASRADKIARIGQLACTHFVDDLEEVFADPGFPDSVERLLFAPDAAELREGSFRAFDSWPDITEAVFGAAG